MGEDDLARQCSIIRQAFRSSRLTGGPEQPHYAVREDRPDTPVDAPAWRAAAARGDRDARNSCARTARDADDLRQVADLDIEVFDDRFDASGKPPSNGSRSQDRNGNAFGDDVDSGRVRHLIW